MCSPALVNVQGGRGNVINKQCSWTAAMYYIPHYKQLKNIHCVTR